MERVDIEIVFDAYRSTGNSADLWNQSSDLKLYSNPIVRDLGLSSADQADRLILAFGHQIIIYRRLRFSDIVFSMVYLLNKARASSVERKNTLLCILQYDLHLMALKMGLNNFAACLFGILQTCLEDSRTDPSPDFCELYRSIFSDFGVEPRFEELLRMENIHAVRQTVAQLLASIDETTQQIYLLNFSYENSKSVQDAVIEVQNSQSARQVDIFKPRTYAVILHLAMVLAPAWHRALFKRAVGSRRAFGQGFLSVVSVHSSQELFAMELQLYDFAKALQYAMGCETAQSEDSSTTNEFLSLVNKAPPGRSLQGAGYNLGNIIHHPASLVSLSKDGANELRVALSAAEILGLFANFAADKTLVKSLDHASTRLLTTQFLDDLIDHPAEIPQLKLIYFKLIEMLQIESKPLPPIVPLSKIIEPGEVQLFKEIVSLKQAIAIRKTKIAAAVENGADPKSSPQVNEATATIEKIVGSILRKVSFLHVDFLAEIFPLMLAIDKLEVYVELLVSRLSYLQSLGEKLNVQIENSKKILAQAEDGVTKSAPANQNWFHFNFAEKDRLVSNEQQLVRIQAEEHRVFTQIFSILYDVSGVEVKEVEIVKLPNFLRNIRWIAWLWDLIYCNKKRSVAKVSLPELRDSCPEKLSGVQTYMLQKTANSIDLLLRILRTALSSSNAELRRAIMMWLLNEGKVGLVEQIDPTMSDDYLTGSLCSIIKAEGLLIGDRALDNHKFLIKNMADRKQHGSALKLIQDLLDNSLLGVQHKPTIEDISSTLIDNEQEDKRLFNLNPTRIAQLKAAAEHLPVVNLQERSSYIEMALNILKEADSDQLETQKYMLNRYFDERKRICDEQLALLNEVSSIHYKLTKVLELVKRTANPTDPLAGSIFEDPHLFMQRDYPRVLASLEKRLSQLELISTMLNVRLWNTEVVFNRIVVPLELHKYIAMKAIVDKSLVDNVKRECIQKSIDSLIEFCSRTQTLGDVIYLADLDGNDRVSEIPHYTQMISPDSRAAIIELEQAEILWPSNIKNQLSAVFKDVSRLSDIKEQDKKTLCTSFLRPSEYLNARSPYIALLLSNANEYLESDNAAGMVTMAVKKESAKPFLEVYFHLAPVWDGDLLVSVSSVVLKAFGPALDACASLYDSYIIKYGELQERRRSYPLSEQFDLESDILNFSFVRLLLILSKVVETYTAEVLKSQSALSEEFTALHRRMLRMFNDLIARVNNSATLLPRELVAYASHSVLKCRHELDEAIHKCHPNLNASMRSRQGTPTGESSIRMIRRLSSGYNRSNSYQSLDKSTASSSKGEKPAKKGPYYYVMENCYVATWEPIKQTGQNEACVIFFGTGELAVGYLAVKKQTIVISGPLCMFGPTGSVILCECEDGKLEGVGLLRLANGDIVVGEWYKGFKNGASVSYNIESDKKVFASFSKGEVKVLERTALGPISQTDLYKMFPDVELSLEALVASSPLFYLERSPNFFYVGTSDKRLGIQIHNQQFMELGFLKDGNPHGHCRKTEINGNLMDAVFCNGKLNGPGVCFLREMEVWTYASFKDDKLTKTKQVYTDDAVPLLASLQELFFPSGCPKFSKMVQGIVPFIDLDPFYFSEVEADYVRSAMEAASIPVKFAESGISLFLPQPQVPGQAKLMESISEEPTLEDEYEEDLSTRAGDKSACKKEPILIKSITAKRGLSNRS